MAGPLSSPEELTTVSKLKATPRDTLHPRDSRWPYRVAVNVSAYASPLSGVPSAKTNVELPENSW
jgi:hypothetical protein